MPKTLERSILIAIACVISSFAFADAPKQIDVPAGDLLPALESISKQAGVELVFQPEQLKGLRTKGVNGVFSSQDAVKKLLEGTQLELRTDETTGAMMIGAAGSRAVARTTSLLQVTGEGAGTTDEGSLKLVRNEADSTKDGENTKNDSPSPEGESAKLEEIVVTAQKRQERIQDVPVPVSAISGEALASSNQLRVQDYYNRVPGLGLSLIGNGSLPSITIRGVTTGGATNPTVGVVVDEVSYGPSVTGGGTATVADVDPSDLARIEVLRGPQGTLYGASSIGGLLKFVTVDPAMDRLSGRVQVGATSVHRSNDLGFSVRGAVNLPLSDTVAVRASGFTTRDPGYVDNPQTGEDDVNERDSNGGRLSALWRPSDDFSLKLSALIQESKREGPQDVDVTLGPDPQQAALSGTGTYGRDTQAYSALATARVGSVELVSATGYSIDTATDNPDFSAVPAFSGLSNLFFGVAGSTSPFEAEVKKFTQEVRASMPLGPRIDWLLGAFYTDEDLALFNDTQAIDTATGEVAGSVFSIDTPSSFEEYALFTNFTVDITARLDIQLGGRFSENRQNFQTIFDGALVGNQPSPSPEVTSKDRPFTYLLTPRFRLSSDWMVYARLASGYRPGGPNVSCGAPQVPCEFDADTTRNFEIGVKGSLLDRRLTFDASLYHIDWQDIQISGLSTNTVPSFIYTGNGSEARSRGVELAFESRPLPGLVLAIWGAYNEAELTESFPTGTTTAAEAGDRLPYSSRVSGHFSIDQEFPLWDAATGSLGASVSYVGDRKGVFRPLLPPTLEPLARETFPAYTQVDLRAGLEFDTWTLNAFVTNMTDKRGILRGGDDAIFGHPTYFTYIQPRTIGLSLAKVFDR